MLALPLHLQLSPSPLLVAALGWILHSPRMGGSCVAFLVEGNIL